MDAWTKVTALSGLVWMASWLFLAIADGFSLVFDIVAGIWLISLVVCFVGIAGLVVMA